DLCRLLLRSWNKLMDRFFAGGFGNFEKPGRTLQSAAARAITVVEAVLQLAAQARAKGLEIAGADVLANDLEAVLRMEAKARWTWLGADLEMMKRARSDYERGEYQFVEDILNAL